MSGEAVLERLVAERLLAIVRVERADDAAAALAGLAEAGVRFAEVSLATPAGLTALSRGIAAHGDELTLGAGTVRTVGDAEAAIAAGARFLVSPGLDLAVHEVARAHGMLHAPGVLSPTELDTALRAGVELIKLFPAGRLGPAYVSDLLAPFPGARLLATGGVDADNARAFLEAGAVAVALGGALVPAGVRPTAADVAARARRVQDQLTLSPPAKERRAD
jgi:2-dehydro-3-deoxyphosphogluconate aldolase / (4S)-4-hydroxy-2-oxoglutarate aldolase